MQKGLLELPDNSYRFMGKPKPMNLISWFVGGEEQSQDSMQ